VSNFDRLSNTRDLIVSLKSGVRRDKIFRVLDDTICVAKAETKATERFTEEMLRVSRTMDLPLAKECSKNEKAFMNQTEGTVLGIRFDSKTMEWSLPEEKAEKTIRRCLSACGAQHMDLKQTQQLMGSVNDLSQMCPTVKFHKGSGNLFLANSEEEITYCYRYQKK
jgi:hypothetical protein